MSRWQNLAMLIVAVAGAWPVVAASQIAEIVVTTRKKEERLQDVPIAVTAITADQIARQGVADLGDVVKASPSVQFDRSFGPSDTRITIRGLSNTRGRSNVAFLVDNIDVTTENLIVAGSGLLANRRLLTDVERIEIVKGPQSALYGRAAFAGAINYITKEPGDAFEGNTRVDFADDGFQQVDGAFGGPVTDAIGMRVTGFWYNQDGHYVNMMSGDDVGGSDGSGAALTTVVRPNDITKIKLRAEYSQEDYDPLPNIRVGGGWQDFPGARLYEYPEAMLQNARNRVGTPSLVDINALGASGSTESTGFLDFNQYCPERLKDPGKGPGLCLPSSFGDVDGAVVKHSENPLTGQDFDGTDLETFRLSSIVSFDMDGGTLTSYTGWTNFDADDAYDQDWQAEGLDYRYTPPGGTPADYPATPSPGFYNGRIADQLTASQIANTTSEVDQFSQELRFASRLDGPLQYTVGGLFWDETRSLYDRNAIIACMPLDKVGVLSVNPDGSFNFPEFFFQANPSQGNTTGSVCDGGTFNGNPTVIGWQEYYRQQQPQAPTYWRADTRHWSFYGKLEWAIADDWTFEFEERFVSERFRLLKPNQSTCTTLGYISVIGSSLRQERPGDPFDAVCPWQEITDPGAGYNDGIITNADSIRTLEASTSSHFNTPKATLNWKAAPDSLVFFSWARAQKPGGINTLTGGGSPVTRKDESFEPEKLEAWELGTKNMFDVGGSLLANVTLFFQDYTDKQTNTQVIDASGVAAPKVLNASGAEIWGAEFEFTWQPDLIEGLVLDAAYTYLDAEYTEFIDDVTSVQRMAYLGDCTLVYKGANGVELSAGDPGITSAFCRADLSGNKLERTPEHAVALSASYTRPLLDTGLDLLLQTNANWTDDRYSDQDNGAYFESYWLVDLRAGLTGPRYEILAYVDNVFDDDTIRSGGSGPDFGRQVAETAFTAGLGVSHFFGTLPDPRIFGVRATYRFGAH